MSPQDRKLKAEWLSFGEHDWEQKESIRRGNLCVSYGAVIADLSHCIARGDEGIRRRAAVKVLKEALERAYANHFEFADRFRTKLCLNDPPEEA
jgi:hypothetical protein